MNARNLVTVALVAGLILAAALSVVPGLAQEPPTGQEQQQAVPAGVGDQAALVGSIPVQGKLTDATGNLVNGSKQVTFRLWNALSAGTAVCVDGPRAVVFTNGLFSDKVVGCNSSVFNGQQLWLGIQVAPDAEMAPRQAIYPVPYAMSLNPGASIIGDKPGWNALYAENDATTGQSYGLRGLSHSSSGRGVSGEGYGGAVGVRGEAQGSVGVWAQSNGTTRSQALFRATNTNATHGMAAYITNNSDFATAHFENTGTGETLYVVSAGGTLLRGISTSGSGAEVFDVEGNGDTKQARSADGLVKAAVVANCGTGNNSPIRWFNNNAGSVTVAGTAGGACTIDFGFKVNDRFFVAMASGVTGDRAANCRSSAAAADETKLFCERWTGTTGTSNTGEINVVVY